MEDPIEEAKRIVETAAERNIPLRLLGGISFYLRCPSAKLGVLERNYADIDLIAYSRQSRAIKQLFGELGYVPREKFNAVQGDRRLIFNDIEHQRRVDVFLDVFEMCHVISFGERLEIDRYTISLADMLATKLQIVEINEKDLKDVISLLIDYKVAEKDLPDVINGAYLAMLCSADWGIYRTFTANLDKLLGMVGGLGLREEDVLIVSDRINALKEMIEAQPKSLRWKLRARVGERVRWYELPEADKQVVDSRVTP